MLLVYESPTLVGALQEIEGDGDVVLVPSPPPVSRSPSPPPVPRLLTHRPVPMKVFVCAGDGLVGVVEIDVAEVISLGTGFEDRLNVPRGVWFPWCLDGLVGVFEIDVIKVVGSETDLEDRLNVFRRVWFPRYLGGISR